MSSNIGYIECMARIYLSNIRADWPIARQEGLLDDEIPEWRNGSVYRDVLSRAELKKHATLMQRDSFLLRQGSRYGSTETVIVASLTVLARTPTDLMAVLMRLAARHERLRAIAEKQEIDPAATDLDAIKAAFGGALRRFSGVGVTGGQASGKKRMAAAQAKLEQIRPFWPLPSTDYPTKMLCKDYGVSRPTVILYLGSRRAAQLRHVASLKTAENNRRRKERGEA